MDGGENSRPSCMHAEVPAKDRGFRLVLHQAQWFGVLRRFRVLRKPKENDKDFHGLMRFLPQNETSTSIPSITLFGGWQKCIAAWQHQSLALFSNWRSATCDTATGSTSREKSQRTKTLRRPTARLSN